MLHLFSLVRRRLLDASEPRLESPQQLAERYWRELCELVEHQEISPRFARRIMEDVFEPETEVQPRTVRWAVWRAYVEEQSNRAR